jgi:ECF sigma factor
MDEALGHEITELLQAWRQGDEGALEKLTPQVYRELHRAAKGCIGTGTGRPYSANHGADQ